MPSSLRGQIPLTYHIAFTWWEPILAFCGALQAYLTPSDLIELTLRQPSYTSALHPLFTQIAGGWILLAFHDAVTLRLTQDVRVWTSLLFAGLLSDLMYTLSLYEGLGPEIFWNPLVWDFDGWVTFVTTVPIMFLKVAFVLRIGLEGAWRRREGKDD
jgi:hypothetical protein